MPTDPLAPLLAGAERQHALIRRSQALAVVPPGVSTATSPPAAWTPCDRACTGCRDLDDRGEAERELAERALSAGQQPVELRRTRPKVMQSRDVAEAPVGRDK